MVFRPFVRKACVVFTTFSCTCDELAAAATMFQSLRPQVMPVPVYDVSVTGPAKGRPSSWICERYHVDCSDQADDGNVLRSKRTSEKAGKRTFQVAAEP